MFKRAINGEILEDRVVGVGGAPITAATIDPATQKRYGYIQAVLVETDEVRGILTLKKLGSVEATPDGVFPTPARDPHVGRFFITGARYCSCKDFQDVIIFHVSAWCNKQKSFPSN